MDNKKFDSQLKSALENLEAPLETTAWAAFEQRFPAPTAPAADAVDQALRRSLEQLETPYQPTHWELLAGRMTRIEQLRRRIWVSKSAELAILLLLFLLANAYGFFGFQSHKSAPATAPVPQEPLAKADKGRFDSSHPAQSDNDVQGTAGSFFVSLDPSQRPNQENLENVVLLSETAIDAQALAPNVAILAGQNGSGNRSLLLPFGPLSTVDFLTLPILNLLN
ncbi:MAG: hypothetical protein ABIO24_12965, partial [Saprospiraceae bacterium]